MPVVFDKSGKVVAEYGYDTAGANQAMKHAARIGGRVGHKDRNQMTQAMPHPAVRPKEAITRGSGVAIRGNRRKG